MDLGRQRTHTSSIRSLPIEEYAVKEKLFSLWTVWSEQDSHGSDGWVSTLVRLIQVNVLLLGEPWISME